MLKKYLSYSVEIKDEYRCFYDTVYMYRKAVSSLVVIFNAVYDSLKHLSGNDLKNSLDKLIHGTSKREAVFKSFDKTFHKFPSYFRRSAVSEAWGNVISYRKNLEQWKQIPENKRGKRPILNRNRNIMPCFYKGNMFQLHDEDNTYTASIKLWYKNDWVFKSFRLCASDLRYITDRFDLSKAVCPRLKKKGNRYSLVFAFESSEIITVKKKNIAVGVDIGLNHSAVCGCINQDGTVLGRCFIDFPEIEDRLSKILTYIENANRRGAKKPRRLWRWADNYNKTLSIEIARSIVEYACSMNADVIVMEHLSSNFGKRRGHNKNRQSKWRKREIIKLVEEFAHKKEIQFSTVNQSGTSLYAFDGSGKVKRDKKNMALCTFSTGKQYASDLSAAYNIAARYFIRMRLKSHTEMYVSLCEADVPGIKVRTQSTLATLWGMETALKHYA